MEKRSFRSKVEISKKGSRQINLERKNSIKAFNNYAKIRHYFLKEFSFV